MKLIDASAAITANLYDDEREEFLQKRTTVGELVDFCSEEGCPEAVEAIPVEWIEKHIKELQESFASFTGWPVIENMLMKWKEEQK